jgi:hypothetical protein
MLTTISNVLESPYTALVVAVLFAALALGGKLSVTLAQIVLPLTWFVIVFALRSQEWPIIAGWGAISAGTLILLADWIRPDLVPKSVGVLEPKVETFYSAQTNSSEQQLQIGDTGPVFAASRLNATPLSRIWKEDDLLIETINGRLKVSTKIRDQRGTLVAELNRNEWKVAPSPKVWDRNYSDDTLEVKDETGRIVLQIKLLSDRLQLQGEWWKDEINGVGLFKTRDNGGIIAIFGTGFKRKDAPEIEPLFVYPSDSHLGELRKSPSRPPVASDDNIYQAGVVVGKVFGGRRSPNDATLFEFQEITHANQFNLGAEFEYQGYILKMISYSGRGGFVPTRPEDGTIVIRLEAKVVRQK